jgi:ketosteroid isomerase-like protein
LIHAVGDKSVFGGEEHNVGPSTSGSSSASIEHAANLLRDRFSDNPEQLLDVVDRSDITNVILQFEEGVRTESIELITSVFSDDASLDYPGEHVEGLEQIRAYYLATFDPNQPIRRTIHTFDTTGTMTPFLGNTVISVNRDTAHCDSMTLAIHSGLRNGNGVVIMRAVADSDDLMRTANGWKINHRKHTIIWGFEVPASTPARP